MLLAATWVMIKKIEAILVFVVCNDKIPVSMDL